jgi:DNA-binding transcriptional ArsR family regulator
MDKRIFELQAEICKALGNPLRLEIIEILGKRELCFSDILEETGGLKSTLSQQLSIMVDKGILKSRKDSRCVYFMLSSPKVAKACSLMREVLVENAKKRNLIMQSALQ